MPAHDLLDQIRGARGIRIALIDNFVDRQTADDAIALGSGGYHEIHRCERGHKFCTRS
jgi:hypothetical protein